MRDLIDHVANAVAQRLAPTLRDRLDRHQERFARLWLTPAQTAKLAKCNDTKIRDALRSGALPASFNRCAKRGHGAYHIRREDALAWIHRQRKGTRRA